MITRNDLDLDRAIARGRAVLAGEIERLPDRAEEMHFVFVSLGEEGLRHYLSALGGHWRTLIRTECGLEFAPVELKGEAQINVAPAPHS